MTTRLQLSLSLSMLFFVTNAFCQKTLADYIFDQSELTVNLVDIDNDNDMDAFIGSSSKIYYFENDGNGQYSDMTNLLDMQIPEVKWKDLSMDFTDIDGDGDYDLSILGNESSEKELYLNDGTKEFPSFKIIENNPLEVMDLSILDGSELVGYTDAYHSWADLDNDGDKDCIIGGKLGWFLYYENIGDPQTPILSEKSGVENPLAAFRVDGGDEGTGMQYESSPYLVDIDVDGDFDLFSGNQMGTFHFYENVGTAAEAIFVERYGRDNPLSKISVAEDSKVVITDEDCDGLWEAYYSGEGQNSIQVEELNRYQVKPIKVIMEDDVLDLYQESVVLSGGYPLGGEWSGSGVVDGQFNPAMVGEGYHRISYTVMTDYGCLLNASEILTVQSESSELNTNLPVGVNVQAKYDKITIENPLKIKLNITLADQQGNVLQTQQVNHSLDLDLDMQTSGIYLVNVSTSTTNHTEKMFLSR